MKTKQLGIKIVTTLFVLSMVLVFSSNSSVTANTNANNGQWLSGATIRIQGDRDVSASPLSIDIGLQTYNASQAIVLPSRRWSEEMAPSDLGTSGVTRTYSSTYAGRITTPVELLSSKGIYHTLRVIDENDFVEHNLNRDLTIQTFYTDKAISETINETMQQWGLTIANFTPDTAHLQMAFDKGPVNAFFASVAADENYAIVADNHFTDPTMVTDLLSKHFRTTLSDLVYTCVNMTGWAASESIGTEITNYQDVRNGTIHGSIRNAATGYIGYYLENDGIIGSMGVNGADNGGDWFVGIQETETSYLINFNIAANFLSGGKIVTDFGLALSQFFPSTPIVEDGEVVGVAFPFYVHVLIGLIVAFPSGGIAYAVEKKKSNKQRAFWMTFGIALAITVLFMLLAFPVTGIFT